MKDSNRGIKEKIQLGEEWATVVWTKRKTLAIEITREGKITVRAPYFCSLLEIERLVHEKERWIEKKLLQMRQEQFQREQLPKEEINKENEAERIRFLTAQARNELPKRVKEFSDQMGVTVGKITIRHQKTRWGSCSAKGNLNFNCMIMAMPKEIQDYVIVHELCHRKEMNHSAAFWKEVEAVLPDYQSRRKWLRENGNQVG